MDSSSGATIAMGEINAIVYPASWWGPSPPTLGVVSGGDRNDARRIPNPESRPYRTPCIKRLISGAIRNSNTPGMASAQKPKV